MSLLISELLSVGALRVHGKFAEASNLTLLVTCELGNEQVRAVFKPVAGMRPLSDFDATTLPVREVAAYTLSELAGWDCIPLTRWREDSEFGPGSIQVYVEDGESVDYVDVVAPSNVHAGMRIAFEGEDENGSAVQLVHRDDMGLRTLALFDAITNNADRKASHILNSGERILGIDNGLTFHPEEKMRTVLWGWAGEELSDSEVARLDKTRQVLQEDHELFGLSALASSEIQALHTRIENLLLGGVMPHPDPLRRCIPWPVF